MTLCKKLANLKIEECFGQNCLITRVELRQNCGIDISVAGYANLGKAVTHFVNRLSTNRLNDSTTLCLQDSLNIKKPGPKIRGCSTTGKLTRSFATERVSLDSV